MSSPLSTQPIIRCAIYTRKSTEEGLAMEYNSLEAQRDSAEAYIRSQQHEGWQLVQDRYDDGAYSGGNMERPALKRLLEDIKSGTVQMVVVYKIDRLSRSLMDFATLAKIFEQNGASFTSVTEQFSTANAIGRLHLNMILSFAQFEREIAGERIRDKIAASKKKGMWMGGSPPMGYDSVDRKLVVNPAEAEIVQRIYKRYVELGSLVHVACELREAGVKNKTFVSKRGTERQGKHLTTSVIYNILRNPLYIGKISHKGELYEGQHEAIIPLELWEKAQKKEDTSPRSPAGRPLSSPHQSMLNGLVHCGCCKCVMTHYYSRNRYGRVYRYFVSSAVKRGMKDYCAVGNVSAPELENMVMAQIRAIIRQPEMVTSIWERLNDMKKPLPEEQIHARLENLDAIWEELFLTEQRQFVGLMVEKVEMSPQGANLFLRADGFETLVQHMAQTLTGE